MKVSRFATVGLFCLELVTPCLSHAESSCAKLVDINGESCADLHYRIDMSSCPESSLKGNASVDCKADQAVLTWRSKSHQFTGKLSHGPESWGHKPWVVASLTQSPLAAEQKARKQAIAVAPPTAAVPQANVTETAPQITYAAATEGNRAPSSEVPTPVPTAAEPTPQSATVPLTVRAYIDTQFRWLHKDTTNSGFAITDGALLLSHTQGRGDFFVDLPFKWKGATDSDGDGTNDTFSNDFAVATAKAQAYAGYTTGGTSFRLGQFDTIYGFELNDAPDLVFATQGLLYNYMMPVTHTGILLTQTMGGFSGRALAANVSNQGSKGTSNDEYGAQFGWANSNLRFTAGYLTLKRQNGEVGLTRAGNRSLADFLAGVTIGKFTLDTEVSLLKEPGMNSGTGILVIPAVTLSEGWTAAVRYEYLAKVPGISSGVLAMTHQEHWQLTGGTQYQLSDALRLKLDYTYGELKADPTATKTFNRSALLAAVYKL